MLIRISTIRVSLKTSTRSWNASKVLILGISTWSELISKMPSGPFHSSTTTRYSMSPSVYTPPNSRTTSLAPSNNFENGQARVVCVGEIGLDYHWHTDNIEEQKRVFIDQIQLANEVKKPVMIHSRDAMRDTIDILKTHKPLYGCVMHCFSGSVIEAHECIELGFMISIGGPVTFKNGVTPREVVNITPLDQLLIETDAPYLTPHPFRGKRNESSYIPLIGEQVANLKGLSISDLQEVLFTNYHRTFKSGL